MKAETLKKAILQYAMQGKLVEQDPNDEPASVLLERIKAEKEQLIKDGKIKKEKPLPPITDYEIPFELPKGWVCERLGSILEIARGGSPRPIQDYLTNSPDGLNWIKIGDSDKGGKYINSTKEKITKEGLHKTRYVKKGDFLLSNSMSFGRPYILNIDGCIHDGWLVLSNIERCFFKDFLYYLLSSYYIFQQFCGSVSGAVVKNLNTDKVSNAIVCIPPLAEQERIVEKLEQILPLVEEYGKNEEKLSKLNSTLPDKIKQSILQYAVQGKLVPQNPSDEPASELLKRIKAEKEQLIKDDKIKKEKPLPPITEDEIPYELPNGWAWVRFSEVFDVRDGTHDSPKSVPNGIPLITSKDFNNGKIDFSNAKLISKEDHDKIQQRSFVEDDDILYSMIGGNIGNMVMVKKDRDFSIKNVALFKYYSKELSNPQYLKLLLSAITIDFKNKAFGGAQQFVSLTFIRNYVIALPPLVEQQRIVTKVEELLAVVDKLK